jgi:hypothetical protein
VAHRLLAIDAGHLDLDQRQHRGFSEDYSSRRPFDCFNIVTQSILTKNFVRGPVGTHASIFLRVLMVGAPGGNKARKDFAGKIWELFINGKIQAADYRDGLCTSLNARAAAGEFGVETAG